MSYNRFGCTPLKDWYIFMNMNNKLEMMLTKNMLILDKKEVLALKKILNEYLKDIRGLR